MTGRTATRPRTLTRFGAGDGRVSSTSAARFAERVRAQRRRRAAIGAAALLIGLALGWLVFASPVLSVSTVEVRGTSRVPAAQVRALVEADRGRSMALLDPTAVARRVVTIPLVRAARVTRSWPTTVVVTVTERTPIAAVPVTSASGKRFALTDPDGVVVDTVAVVPAGLPVVVVDVAKAGAESLRAARQVAGDIPADLRAGVRTLSATSPDDVSFVLADGSTVVWGSAADGARKAAALKALHPQPVKHPVKIDVSAPDAPALG